MKVKMRQNGRDKLPITLHITLEDQRDLLSLYHCLNMPSSDVRRKAKISAYRFPKGDTAQKLFGSLMELVQAQKKGVANATHERI